MKSINKVYDLIDLGLMTNELLTDIKNISSKHAYRTILDGSSVTSREKSSNLEIEVFIVTGDIIYEKLKWLDTLYRNEFLDYANSFSTEELECSNDLKSGININILKGIGAKYEWHIDSNPLTGLLFGNHSPA